MKNLTKISTIAALLILSSCNVPKKIDKASLKTQQDKVSYSIGYELGKNFKKQSLPIDTDVMKEGVRNGLAETPSLLTDKEMKDTMMALQKDMMDKQMAKAKELGTKSQKDGEDFLAKKKT